MDKRKLGNTGFDISPIAFGGNVFGWTIDEPTSFKILDGFFAAGGNFIDTADVYSRWKPGNQGGESETIIGNWMKRTGHRHKLVIVTKVGMDMGEGQTGLKKAHIIQSAEDSLKRLQSDYIDLYLSHTDDTTTPLEETLEAYQKLIKQGKVRAIGASNYQADRLAQALAVSAENSLPRYEVLESCYGLCDRSGFEVELEPLCVKNHIAMISYYSLAKGFLTGKYRSENDLHKSVRGEGVKKYLNDQGFRILAALDQVAARYNAQPASIAIAWLLARPSVTAPIASATSLPQLESLLAATQIHLDKEAIEQLNQASA